METFIAGAVLVLGTVAVLSGISQFFQWIAKKMGNRR